MATDMVVIACASTVAHQALAKARERCWECDWVLEFDIKGYFYNIDHDLLMKVIGRHTQERWLKAPVKHKDGTQEQWTKARHR